MSLSKRLKQIQVEPGPSQCRTCAWLAGQSEEDRTAFWGWVDEGKPTTELLRAVQAEGLDVAESSLRRHNKSPKCRGRLNTAVVKRLAS